MENIVNQQVANTIFVIRYSQFDGTEAENFYMSTNPIDINDIKRFDVTNK